MKKIRDINDLPPDAKALMLDIYLNFAELIEIPSMALERRAEALRTLHEMGRVSFTWNGEEFVMKLTGTEIGLKSADAKAILTEGAGAAVPAPQGPVPPLRGEDQGR
jgi:hypothetical protein